MATTSARKIAYTFGCSTGSKRTWSFNYAMSTPDGDEVIAAMDAFIANADIFKYQPVSKEAAQLITTTKVDLAVSA